VFTLFELTAPEFSIDGIEGLATLVAFGTEPGNDEVAGKGLEVVLGRGPALTGTGPTEGAGPLVGTCPIRFCEPNNIARKTDVRKPVFWRMRRHIARCSSDLDANGTGKLE
jgi:hypothetical protein